METQSLQVAFLSEIKKKLPPNLSFVDEIAESLNISNDSAYRRIRGEKPLSIDELQLLAIKYKISLDSFLQSGNDTVVLWGRNLRHYEFEMENYLDGIGQQLSIFARASEKHMYYHNKDIPIFHHFMFPELAAFKCYFWSRYNLDYPKYNRGTFLIEDFIDIFEKKGKLIADLYLQIPSTEIWNLDCINTTIRQIDYYRESRLFKSDEDIHVIYNCLEKQIDCIEQQVEAGYKLKAGNTATDERVKYRVYINEFVLGDNTIFVELGSQRMVFLNHNVINYSMTTNPEFVNYTFETLNVLLRKSTLISEISERDRQLFFDLLRERIHQRRKIFR